LEDTDTRRNNKMTRKPETLKALNYILEHPDAGPSEIALRCGILKGTAKRLGWEIRQGLLLNVAEAGTHPESRTESPPSLAPAAEEEDDDDDEDEYEQDFEEQGLVDFDDDDDDDDDEDED
jgi:hypothetical protein